MNISKEQALSALLTSSTIREAARKCGLSERTLNGYLREDQEFKTAYEQHRQSIVRNATERMTNALSSAVDVLSEVMTDKENSAGTRITAAKHILEYGLKLWEITDITARLEAIEARLKDN